MMVETALRRIEDAQPALAYSQTEVKILINSRKFLGKPADLVKQPTRHHRACGGNSADLAGAAEGTRMTVGVAWKEPHHMIGGAAKSKYYSSVLYALVRI